MYCSHCGTLLEEGTRFCQECGIAVDDSQNTEIQRDEGYQLSEYRNRDSIAQRQSQLFQQKPPLVPTFTGIPIRNYDPGLDYNPVGMWGYFFYTILLNIPVVGWIFMIVFAVGVTKNINLRNYSRAWLCGYAVALIFIILTWWPYIKTMFTGWLFLR